MEYILFLLPIGILSILLSIPRFIYKGEKIGKISTIADLILTVLLVLGFTYFFVISFSPFVFIALFCEVYVFSEAVFDLKTNY